MEKLFVPVLLMLISFRSAGQTVTSVADGDWSDPSTWDCDCVPGSNHDVVVAHHVAFEEWIAIDGGSLTVTASGYMDGFFGGSLYLNCGAIIHGVIDLENIQLDDGLGDPFVNYGFVSTMYLTNDREGTQNSGTLSISSAMVLDQDLFNEVDAYLDVFDMYGSGTLTNYGTADIWAEGDVQRLINFGELDVQTSDTTRIGYFSNAGEATLWGGSVDSLVNTGALTTATVHIAMNYEGNGSLWVMPQGQDLIIDSTAHATITAPGGWFVSDGDLRVFGLIDGDGRVCVADETFNAGTIAGTLDICDLSPTAQEWPFLDVNNGTVEPTVSFCEALSCTISVPEIGVASPVSVFPVPADDRITIAGGLRGDRLRILDLSGRLRMDVLMVDPMLPVDIGGLEPGTFIVRILRERSVFATKLVVQ